jgi:hypothetical protein
MKLIDLKNQYDNIKVIMAVYLHRHPCDMDEMFAV